MDAKNPVHTPGSYTLMRAEHVAVVCGCVVLSVVHAAEINWWRYAAAFWIIDIIGYIPGAIAYGRGRDRSLPLPAAYHIIYDVMHTYLTVGTGLAIWAYAIGGFEWSMLGAILHLSVDRGVFGNVFKPRIFSFEPVTAAWPVLAKALAREEPHMSAAPDRKPRMACNPATVIDHPSGFLALNERHRIFEAPGITGFIPYRERGSHYIVFGGVHSPLEERAELFDAFLRTADERRRRVVALQVRQDQVELFSGRGFTVNEFGTSFALDLERFSLEGSARVKLRNKISRARRKGLRVLELGHDVPRDRASFERLYNISRRWLADKGRAELDFLIGEIGTPDDNDRRIFLVVDAHDADVAFITYVPVWGARPGWLHDLTRRVPDAPPGAMEFCNAEAIARLRNDGCRYLHFGFTPFITQGHNPASANRFIAWGIEKLRLYGQFLYPAETQAQYKLKWGVDILDSEFIAARPMSARAILDVLTITKAL
jgi:lysylphosphatidylglycerol synthetase-like protein (DUF2156 family)